MLYVQRDFQWIIVSAAIPLANYNGAKSRGMKWFFYVSYRTDIADTHLTAK